MRRVESVCKRQRDQVEQQPHPADQVGPVRDVARRLSIEFGLGLVRPGLGRRQPLLELADRGEILVELVAIGGADAAREALRPRLCTVSMMLCPSRSFRTCCRTSAGVPSRKSLANTRDGRLSAGIITPPRVYERLGVPVPSTSDGNRVSRPIVSAANWSSETRVLETSQAREPRRRQPAHLRRMAVGAGLIGMRQPGEEREVVAEVLEDFEIGRQRVIRAGLAGKQKRRVQAERRANADHARARRRGGRRPRSEAGRRPAAAAPAQRPCRGETCDDASSAEEHGSVHVSPESSERRWVTCFGTSGSGRSRG